jgi:outer membrane usher protein
MVTRWLPCLCASLLAAAQAAAAGVDEQPSDDPRMELFRRVFGHDPPAIPVESEVIVVVDATIRRRVRAVRSPSSEAPLLDGAALTALLAPYLRPEPLQLLGMRMDSRGLLDREALEAMGLRTTFDPRNLEYVLAPGDGLRLPSVVYLTPPLPDARAAQAQRPEPVSGFVNFNVKGIDRTGAASHSSRRADAALDGALNIRGVVLEGSAFGRVGDADSWNRGDLRLVHDQPRHALRFTAGDLAYATTGYQSGAPIGGIGVTRDFTLQPQVLTYWTGEFAFRLDRPAQVQLYSNDSLITTLQLPPGIHDVRQLTPAVGRNDIDVITEDSAGVRQVLHYSFIHDPDLLAPGLDMFSCNAGLARDSRDGDYRYDTRDPAFAGTYRRGLTASTTLGVYAELHEARELVGTRILHALDAGTVSLDSAASRGGGRWDAAARLGLTVHALQRRPEASVAVEFRGKGFDMGTSTGMRDSLNLQASLAARPGWGLTARLGTAYYTGHQAHSLPRYDVVVTLLQDWGRNVNASLSLRHGRTGDAAAGTQVQLALRVILSNATGSYRLSRDAEHSAINAQWNSPVRSDVSTPYGFAAVHDDAAARAFEGGAGYRSSRGLVEAGYRRVDDTDAPALAEASLRVQGALAFAGDAIVLSKSIRENFAIIEGRQGLAGIAMKVDPGRSGSKAGSDWLGPAVVTDLASYRLRSLRIEPVDPPPGATPGNLTFQLAPTYKSGVLLRIGQEPQVISLGRLLDAQGAPIAYTQLEILPTGHPGQDAVRTFTGRNGSFQAAGLAAGPHEFHVADIDGAIDVEVPKARDGVAVIGDVVVPGPGASE